MTTQAVIIALLLVILAGLVVLWFYARAHKEGLSHLIANQEGGRAQSARQADEGRHQGSKIMERMQTVLLLFDKWLKHHDKDPPP